MNDTDIQSEFQEYCTENNVAIYLVDERRGEGLIARYYFGVENNTKRFLVLVYLEKIFPGRGEFMSAIYYRS
jgi:hypothetical protein